MKSKKKYYYEHIFWKSGLHSAWWPKIVSSVIVAQRLNLECDLDEYVINEINRGKKHSEQNAIKSLRQLLTEHSLPSQTIKWFINYSPCRRCSDNIAEFISEARTKYGIVIKIDMVFCFLYQIRRPSRETCCPKCSQHFQKIDKSVHKKNLEGLRQLRSSGVTLRTFKEQDWKDLAARLGVQMSSPYSGSARHIEDQALEQDFQRLLRAPFEDVIEGLVERLRLQLGYICSPLC